MTKLSLSLARARALSLSLSLSLSRSLARARALSLSRSLSLSLSVCLALSLSLSLSSLCFPPPPLCSFSLALALFLSLFLSLVLSLVLGPFLHLHRPQSLFLSQLAPLPPPTPLDSLTHATALAASITRHPHHRATLKTLPEPARHAQHLLPHSRSLPHSLPPPSISLSLSPPAHVKG
jgi:hypothetical protein